MVKELKFDTSAKGSLLSGMAKLAKAVGSTLGPKGQCVIIDEYSNGLPHVTKDGVTVAKNISLEDKYENVGVTLLKQAALSTVNGVGDGTTTSTVLAYNMVQNAYATYCDGIKNLSLLKKGIVIATNHVKAAIKNATMPNPGYKEIATISANNDTEIGSIVGDAFDKVGENGIVTVEESANSQTTVDVIKGMQFERGYVTHWFITDRERGECILENPYILITDQRINLTRDILSIAEGCVKQRRNLLIIAQDFDDEVIQNMKINHLQNILKCCLVKAPSFGDYRKKLLEDLAILTNSTLATYENGIEISNMTIDMLGTCKKVIVDKTYTTILGGIGKIDDRIAELKSELSRTEEESVQDFIKKRIAHLTGGICVIKVGGCSELEMRERKDRIDDAVCAAQAASEEGVVPGGGLTYLKAYVSMPHDSDPAVQQGIDIVKNALTSVFDTIVSNAGYDSKEIGKKVFPDKNISWDANLEEYVDFNKANIINPAKADRIAFENAISILNLFISTNCIITDKDYLKQI